VGGYEPSMIPITLGRGAYPLHFTAIMIVLCRIECSENHHQKVMTLEVEKKGGSVTGMLIYLRLDFCNVN
jgi:hypothetical protein